MITRRTQPNRPPTPSDRQNRSTISIWLLSAMLITIIAQPLTGSTFRPAAATARTPIAAPRYLDPSAASGPVLTFVPNSSVKLQQVIGDCDWPEWDATIDQPSPTCIRTVSQTVTRADVLGNGLGTSFEHDGELIVMFGDTIGATIGGGQGPRYYPTWISFPNTFLWQAGDPIARSTTTRAKDGFLLDFFMDGNHGLLVQPPPQADGNPVDMLGDNTPFAGISLDGQIYITCKTGTVINNGVKDDSQDRSVLVKFDEATQGFSSGRTISQLASGGHFVHPGLYEAPPGILGSPSPVQPEPVVVIFGVGEYRHSNIYLSVIPKSEFESGLDANGNSATRYFAGFGPGTAPRQVWSASESDAVPVVTDLDPANPTIGNFSVFYSQPLGLWLMTFDGGRASNPTQGVYFTYAPEPWGPWSTPQLIFNDCRDKGLGNFIYYYYKRASDNDCPSAMPPEANPAAAPGHSGPAGPTIGDQATNDPHTNRGASFAPQMIQRFTEIAGDTLKIYYNLSTGNPYGVVLMESDFKVTLPADFSLGFDKSAVTVSAPGKTSVTLDINRTGGFSGNVTVAPISTVLSGIKFVGVPSSTTGNAVPFKIKVKANVPHGTYPLTFAGKDDTGRERDAQLTLIVQ